MDRQWDGKSASHRVDVNSPVDFALLDEAAKKLLGYYVYRKFRIHLASISASLQRQYNDGLIESLTQPTARGRSHYFDTRSLDFNALIEVVGVYVYILACHKSSNWRLLQRTEAKQVFYLRGYDFEAAFAVGGGVAAGISTSDTTGFTLDLPSLLRRPFFKVLSPKEVDSETVTAEQYYDDFDTLIRWINQRPAAVYLNALHWKRGVLTLIPRMDHYVVYVSSLTESALWELDQLNTDHRRDRVTVVFDEEAVAKKTSQLALQEGLAGRWGATLWGKQRDAQSLTAAQVREALADVFTVMTPDQFEANIDDVRRRIDHSNAELGPGQRETWLEFEFYPAVAVHELERLRAMSQTLAELVDAGQTGRIDCLPLYVAQLQLRIHLTLLLGDHAATGRALAGYAAVMQSGYDYYSGPAYAGGVSEDERVRVLEVLGKHAKFSEYAGRSLLGFGRSHEFVSQFEQTSAEWDAIFNATRTSVDKLFTT
jgi:hypothetical protein